jgi:hypothetical protein
VGFALAVAGCDAFEWGRSNESGAKVDCVCYSRLCERVTPAMVGIEGQCVYDYSVTPPRIAVRTYTSADVGTVKCSECVEERSFETFCLLDGTTVPTAPAEPPPPPVQLPPWIPPPSFPPVVPGPIGLTSSSPEFGSAIAVAHNPNALVGQGVGVRSRLVESEADCVAFCPVDSDSASIPRPSYFPTTFEVAHGGLSSPSIVPIRGWDDEATVSAWSEQTARYFGGGLYGDCLVEGASASALVASTASVASPATVVASQGPDSIVVDLIHEQSYVVVVSGMNVGGANVRGTAAFTFCGTLECPMVITDVGAVADTFEIRGARIETLELDSHGPLVAVPGGDGTFSIGALSLLNLSAFVDGERKALTRSTGSIAAAGFDGTTFAMSFGLETDDGFLIVVLVGTARNLPPQVTLSVPSSVECSDRFGAMVALDASASSDPDDEIVAYQWTVGDHTFAFGPSAVASLRLPLGSTRVTVTAFDSRGAARSSFADVVVQDSIPPQISAATDVCVWPPNHTMRLFTPETFDVFVSDACDPLPQVVITSVEPVADEGTSGDPATSAEFVSGNAALCVRSERSGRIEEGLTYHVNISAVDGACNETEALVRLHVPHDLGHTNCPRGGKLGGEVVPDSHSTCVASVPFRTCGSDDAPLEATYSGIAERDEFLLRQHPGALR